MPKPRRNYDEMEVIINFVDNDKEKEQAFLRLMGLAIRKHIALEKMREKQATEVSNINVQPI